MADFKHLHFEQRLLTFSRGGSTGDRFEKAKEGTLFHKIFNQHMNVETSFGYSGAGLDRIIGSDEKLAGYMTVQDVLKHGKYDCKVNEHPLRFTRITFKYPLFTLF